MEINELMKPRYRMKINMPCSDYKKGEIIHGDGASVSTHRSHVDVLCSAYPDCYESMAWWEERNVEDMPEYLKCIKTPDQLHYTGEIYKVDWINKFYGKSERGQIVVSTNCYLPATEQDYINQIIT